MPGLLVAVAVEEVHTLVLRSLVSTLGVAVAQGQLQVAGLLAAPLGGDAVLDGRVDGCADLLDGGLVLLGDQQADAVLGVLTGLEGAALEDVHIAEANFSGDDFGVRHFYFPP